VGLQPHQFAWFTESKWGDGIDNDRLQHEKSDEYHGNRKTVGSTQDLEARLQEGYHEQAKTSYFKAVMPTQ